VISKRVHSSLFIRLAFTPAFFCSIFNFTLFFRRVLIFFLGSGACADILRYAGGFSTQLFSPHLAPRKTARGFCSSISHLSLDGLKHPFQLIQIHLLSRPPNAQSLHRVRFRYDVKMYVVDLLVCKSSVVLQDVVVVSL
jgi:hypothetical protein